MLRAPLTIEYPFRRTVGPVQSAFLTGLREGFVLGVRTNDGRVMVPPVEYDPVTADELHELVEVGDEGVVTAWSYQTTASDKHPLATPFAWALVQLDGADTSMLHALDAPIDGVRTGMRVRIRWAEERDGSILDIACFEPLGDPA